HLARAMVTFPGGLGTLDELCEVLTLSQTRKLDRPIPVLLYGREYWEEVINFRALARHGMIAEQDLDLIHYVETPEEALAVLKERLSHVSEAVTPSFARSSTTCERTDTGTP
ncbi:MAG: LOG family protein, partial [Ectothiorhodospiraceae bacterium]